MELGYRGNKLRESRLLYAVDDQAGAITYLINGSKTSFHPVTQQIIAMDEAQGLDREQVINLRAGIMSIEFLGFVPGHVFMVRPDLAGNDEITVEEETISTPRFNPGNWYLLDNPEF